MKTAIKKLYKRQISQGEEVTQILEKKVQNKDQVLGLGTSYLKQQTKPKLLLATTKNTQLNKYMEEHHQN
jgi:hypothetical protein